MSAQDKVFAGSVPKIYETYLVPLIFEPYAADLVSRLKPRNPSRVLEVAAGTGVVTRALASALPESTSIVATDLNQAMLDEAAAVGTRRPVEWRQADATQLPFPDQTLRRRGMPVRRHVLPGQVEGFRGGAPRAERRRPFHFQRLGPNRRERVCGHCDHGARFGLSDRSPTLPGPHPSWLSRSCDHRARSDHGRLHEAAADHDSRGPEQSRVSASAGNCILPRDASAERDRSSQRDRLNEATDTATAAIARRFGSKRYGKIQAHVVAIER